jgi:hypothetical protein
MPTNNHRPPRINNLRIVLNIFYACLAYSTLHDTKQVIFQLPHSLPSISLRIYLSIRSAVSTFCVCLYSILIIYSLWFERVGTLSIVVLLLWILFIVRFVFDLYGYSVGHFEHSLYPPFESIRTKLTQINSTEHKAWGEELSDFTMEFIMNMTGILLTVFIIMRMSRAKRVNRQMVIEALGIELIRRMTV